MAERVELRPADARIDVVPTSCEPGVATMGVRETVSRGSRRLHALAKANVPNAHPRLTRSQPTRRHASRKGWRALRCSQPPYPATDRRLGAPPAAMKGLRSESLFTGRSALYESRSRHPRSDRRDSPVGDPARDLHRARGLESSRVRPDHVLCCIAPAIAERSASSFGPRTVEQSARRPERARGSPRAVAT